MIALTRESFDNQNEIKKENGILPLVRILRSTKTIERVLMTVIRALGTLCIGKMCTISLILYQRFLFKLATHYIFILFSGTFFLKLKYEFYLWEPITYKLSFSIGSSHFTLYNLLFNTINFDVFSKNWLYNVTLLAYFILCSNFVNYVNFFCVKCETK